MTTTRGGETPPLPCPFCGGRGELHGKLRDRHSPYDEGSRAYFYVCNSCAGVGGWGKSETSALRLWNTRPGPRGAATASGEPPDCAGCSDHCNSECSCGSTHHHCGCECHLAQERWASRLNQEKRRDIP